MSVKEGYSGKEDLKTTAMKRHELGPERDLQKRPEITARASILPNYEKTLKDHIFSRAILLLNSNTFSVSFTK